MDLKYEFYINAGPEQVWQTLVSPDETKKIYYGSQIQSTFEVGSSLKYVGPGISGDETVHIQGAVLAFLPYKKFSHTCKVGEAYGSDRAKFESRVTYNLVPVGESTELMLTHDRWMKGDPAYKETKKGWWMILSAIKTLVETGKLLNLGDVGHAETDPEDAATRRKAAGVLHSSQVALLPDWSVGWTKTKNEF